MLPLDASDDALDELRQGLRTTARNKEAFIRLFGAQRLTVTNSDAPLALLARHGLVTESPAGWHALHRVRLIDDRFYVLDLADGVGEYQQDVWPETDAARAWLAGEAPGRLLDVGTGCGLLAIEARRLGHAVVATDLEPRALKLARFNERLNGVAGIDWREGDLFAPVAGERFDRVVSVPHYGRIWDQLRIETLRGGLAHLDAGGRLCVATPLEWRVAEEPRLGLQPFFDELAAGGAQVTVEPIVDTRKRGWFVVPVGETAAGLVARHRFRIVIQSPGSGGPAGVEVAWPAPEAQNRVPLVPLARLRVSRTQRGSADAMSWGRIASAADVAALEELLATLAAPDCEIHTSLPIKIYDGCRFGARVCVGDDKLVGAASAVADDDGRIRTCAQGEAIGGHGDKVRALIDELAARRQAAEARRGCPECVARAVCSRCLSPALFDETAYCALVRRHHQALPVLFRLLRLLESLSFDSLTLRRWPREAPTIDAAAQPEMARLQAAWHAHAAWIVEVPQKSPRLSWVSRLGALDLADVQISPYTAELGAAIANGAPPPDADTGTLYSLASLLGV